MSDEKLNDVTVAVGPTERERWNKDVEFKTAEIELATRDHELAVSKHELESRKQTESGWRGPVIVAILAATITGLGNLALAYINGTQQRALEREKSEQTRILEMIKTGNPDKAAENLKFLLESGLIADPAIVDRLNKFLKGRKAGSGPALPSGTGPFGGIVGVDDAQKIQEVPNSDPLRRSSRSVGQLSISHTNVHSTCTAFLVARNLLVTARQCIPLNVSRTTGQAKLHMNDGLSQTSYNVLLPPLEKSTDEGEAMLDDVGGKPSFAIARVEGDPGAKYGYLPLADRPPEINEKLSAIFFRDTTQQLVVKEAEDCKVRTRTAGTFTHGCDTGGGSSGAPLLTRNSGEVVGIHFRRMSDQSAEATRADLLARKVQMHSSQPER